MKASELIAALEGISPDAEVRIWEAAQPRLPVQTRRGGGPHPLCLHH
jgi:hypothetical protein